jgi:predicted anti-sigma-YlaC factor YlaD
MSCRDAIHLICWYLEGKLTASVAHEVENHLSQCKDCRVILNAATTTLDSYFSTAAVPAGHPDSRVA